MTHEASQAKTVVVTDICQTLADGGFNYFRKFRGEFDLKKPETLVPVYNSFVPLPHSREGLQRVIDISRFGGYYTVRPPQLQQQGTGWLSRYGFPDAYKIRVSKDSREKLEQIAEDFYLREEAETPPPVVLFDDNMEQLLKAATILVEEKPETGAVMKKLIIVGFGNNNQKLGGVQLHTGIRTTTLASWEQQNVSILLRNLNTLYTQRSIL